MAMVGSKMSSEDKNRGPGRGWGGSWGDAGYGDSGYEGYTGDIGSITAGDGYTGTGTGSSKEGPAGSRLGGTLVGGMSFDSLSLGNIGKKAGTITDEEVKAGQKNESWFDKICSFAMSNISALTVESLVTVGAGLIAGPLGVPLTLVPLMGMAAGKYTYDQITDAYARAAITEDRLRAQGYTTEEIRAVTRAGMQAAGSAQGDGKSSETVYFRPYVDTSSGRAVIKEGVFEFDPKGYDAAEVERLMSEKKQASEIRKRSGGDPNRSTILTGARGSSDEPALQKKTLLGGSGRGTVL